MNRRGFTLIEVLVAMALFLIGVSAILGMFQLGGGLDRRGLTEARLAPRLEELAHALRADAWQVDAQGDFTGVRPVQGAEVPGAPGYRWDLVVYPAPEAHPDLVRAEIRFWRRDPERVLARTSLLLPRRRPAAADRRP